MHKSIRETIETLNKKLEGHYRYYGIYGNWISLNKFYRYVKWEPVETGEETKDVLADGKIQRNSTHISDSLS